MRIFWNHMFNHPMTLLQVFTIFIHYFYDDKIILKWFLDVLAITNNLFKCALFLFNFFLELLNLLFFLWIIVQLMIIKLHDVFHVLTFFYYCFHHLNVFLSTFLDPGRVESTFLVHRTILTTWLLNFESFKHEVLSFEVWWAFSFVYWKFPSIIKDLFDRSTILLLSFSNVKDIFFFFVSVFINSSCTKRFYILMLWVMMRTPLLLWIPFDLLVLTWRYNWSYFKIWWSSRGRKREIALINMTTFLWHHFDFKHSFFFLSHTINEVY